MKAKRREIHGSLRLGPRDCDELRSREYQVLFQSLSAKLRSEAARINQRLRRLRLSPLVRSGPIRAAETGTFQPGASRGFATKTEKIRGNFSELGDAVDATVIQSLGGSEINWLRSCPISSSAAVSLKLVALSKYCTLASSRSIASQISECERS
jgi:hypothetical protein